MYQVLVGWQEKKVLSKVPDSSFFGGLGNQVKRFAGQAYGALDRSVGGVLPGAADNPYIGKSKSYFSQPPQSQIQLPPGVPKGAVIGYNAPTPFEKDLGKAVNAAASAVAGVQPAVKNFVTNSPDFVQNTVSSGLNKLPVSANLFGRYYTGLGNKGLELPQSFITDARTAIQENVPKMSQDLVRAQKGEQEMQSDFNEIKQGIIPSKFASSGVDKKRLYQGINDLLAENRSIQNQIEAGNVAVHTAMEQKSSANPLTSLGTSLGSAWFKPTKEGGWTTKEKYDFRYGGADKNQAPTVLREEVLSPSQEFSNAAASAFLSNFNQKQNLDFAAGSPAAMFGRAVVSKMDPTSFEYDINIPRR